jgi:hypothetical protein
MEETSFMLSRILTAWKGVFMKAITTYKGYFGRLKKGEEIVTSLTALISNMGIRNGKITAIGAAERLKLGFYDGDGRKYQYKDFTGKYEITSLTGNISLIGKEPFAHMHINISDEAFHTYGGHLFEGYVSITCEFIIELFDTEYQRTFDEETGLYLINVK